VTDYADLIARLLRISDFVYGDDLENAVEALKAQAKRIAALEYDATYHESNDGVMMRDIEYYRARIAELTAALREAYEVYAGSDGFIPETAAEGYQQQLIKQMVDIIGAALAKENADIRAARAALGEKND